MRSRHEASIKRREKAAGTFATPFEDALGSLAFRHGLAWFTDEQIAEIREEMLRTEWRKTRFSLRIAIENRKRRAA